MMLSQAGKSEFVLPGEGIWKNFHAPVPLGNLPRVMSAPSGTAAIESAVVRFAFVRNNASPAAFN